MFGKMFLSTEAVLFIALRLNMPGHLFFRTGSRNSVIWRPDTTRFLVKYLPKKIGDYSLNHPSGGVPPVFRLQNLMGRTKRDQDGFHMHLSTKHAYVTTHLTCSLSNRQTKPHIGVAFQESLW